jgi:hypothetical protein
MPQGPDMELAPIITQSPGAVLGLPAGVNERDNVLCTTTGAIYYIEAQAKRWYPNGAIYASWGSPPYITLDCATIDKIPNGLDMTMRPTNMPTTFPSLYKDKGFGGYSWTAPSTGTFKLVDLTIKNAASSLKVPTGWKFTVWDKDDCTGNSKVFTSDVDDLSGTGMNDDIACVQVAMA